MTATDDLAGDNKNVAGDGAGKDGGVAESGTPSATPEEITADIPPMAHFYYVRADEDGSGKNMTGEDRCKGFGGFQGKIQEALFGEKLGPVFIGHDMAGSSESSDLNGRTARVEGRSVLSPTTRRSHSGDVDGWWKD